MVYAPQTLPTHAKYVLCHRADRVDTAVFGGVNIGDRFRPWRDFAIRAEGSALVGALAAKVDGPAAAAAAATAVEACAAGGVEFVTNRPTGFDVIAWGMPWARCFPGGGLSRTSTRLT